MRKSTIIRISWYDKTLRIPAERIGEYLALHREWIDAKNKPKPNPVPRYVITHIPTGYAVFTSYGKPFVRKIAKALVPLKWQKIRTPKSKKAIAEIGEQRRSILKAFGVQV